MTRHSLLVRILHALNALCLLVMVATGLQIFNAHPALYLGAQSTFMRPLLYIGPVDREAPEPRGVVRFMDREWDTTGVLGVSKEGDYFSPRAFPNWLTFPPGQDLATARRWHFFFAWLFTLGGGLWAADAIYRRRFDPGAKGYRRVQKLSYVLVLFGLMPLMVLTGMAMSPGLDAALGLAHTFGGRMTARTLHFAAGTLILVFFLAHLVMVLVAGPLKGLKAITVGGPRWE